VIRALVLLAVEDSVAGDGVPDVGFCPGMAEGAHGWLGR